MTNSGWNPEFIAHANPTDYWPGNDGRAAFVAHVTAGTNSVSELGDGHSGKSSTFLFPKRGKGIQFASAHDSAWANGISIVNGKWMSPEGHVINPPWPGLRWGKNPNRYTISAEREGYPNEPYTPDQIDATIQALVFCARLYPSLYPYVPHDTFIAHADISPIDRHNCPGPHCDFAELAAAANDILAKGHVAPAPAHVVSRWRVKPGIDFAAVHVRASIDAPSATIGVNPVRLAPGYVIESDGRFSTPEGDMLHIEKPAPWGYSAALLFTQVPLTTPLGLPQ